MNGLEKWLSDSEGRAWQRGRTERRTREQLPEDRKNQEGFRHLHNLQRSFRRLGNQRQYSDPDRVTKEDVENPETKHRRYTRTDQRSEGDTTSAEFSSIPFNYACPSQ